MLRALLSEGYRMRIKTTLFISLMCGAPFTTAFAQVRPRIARPVDDARFVRVPATTHSHASAANDVGRASGDLPMERILLQLKSSPEQEAALEQLLAEQHDPQSANYHRWLGAEEFGEQFGVAQADLDAVVRWLEGHGFRVNEIARGRRSIEFSGTARQVERAFHTEIHRYEVDGVRHVANAADVAIPEALAGVVGGVASLHDFHARPLHRVLGRYAGQPGGGAAGSLESQTNLNGGSHGLSPYDFAAIYDVAPLWNQGYDGTGQTIAIVADTNVKLTDVTSFRSQFGLGANNVTVVLNGANPGVISGEEVESDLDMEWSGAVAKGAAVKLVVSANTNASDGVTLSAQYIVNNRLAPVVSMSYGLCEADMGSGNALYNNLWSQAAAEGISVFVSAGDSGSAGCDAPESTGSSGNNTTKPAARGFGINGLASTPYNVAVGGTQFSDSTGAYWNASNDAHGASAKGYIPEAVWNESGYTTAGAAANGLWAGSGGYSTIYSTPAWQTGAGVPTVDPVGTGHHRYIPDVSLSGAGHDGYLVEIEGGLYLVGGTSAGAPALAGIMAILVQRAGAWQGNPNARFYPIAAQSPAAYHDITAGTNAVPCQGGRPNCPAAAGTVGVLNGFAAAPGFDLATGLGTVDANALAIAWSSAPAGVTIVSLSPNPMTGSSANQTLTINGSGFAAGATVNLTYAGGEVVNPTIVSVTSTQIAATVNVGVTARTWTVQVVNSATSSSNVANLTVTAPASAPAIASLSPNPMTGSASAQTLTINGSGFVAGATVNLTYSGGAVVHPAIASATGTQIAAAVNVGTTARVWTVQVVNPGGAASSAATLTVTAPSAAPAITSLSPNPMTGSSANQTLTINGSGMVAGATVNMTYSGGAVVHPAIASATGTQIAAAVNVGTTARAWTVQVVNPGGAASSAATLTVTVPPPPPASTSLSPNPMTGSASNRTLTINGSGFVTGATVNLTYTGGAVVHPAISSTTATQIAAAVNVGTTARAWTVQVVNPGGVASSAATLTVTAPAAAPAITSLSPNPMTGSSANQTLTVNGSGFQAGGKVVLTTGNTAYTYTSSYISSVTATQLQVRVNVGTPARAWTVQVVNPDNSASAAVSLTVAAAPPPPAIASLGPSPMTGSASAQTLTMNGTGFQNGIIIGVQAANSSTVTVYSGAQVTVTPTQLKIQINVGTSRRSWYLQLMNPDGQYSNVGSWQVN